MHEVPRVHVIILALDTTTRGGSVALVDDGVVRVERAGDPAVTFGEQLPAGLIAVLDAAGVRIEEVDLLAVGAGPGSFTGLRVGIATIQGLAMAHGKRVVPISILEALAHAAPAGPATVGAWMDAQRGEVCAALYGGGQRALLIPPVSAAPETVLDAWASTVEVAAAVFIGDGAVRYGDLIGRRLGGGVAILPPPPLAGTIGRIAAADPGRAVLPHAIVPIYVRKSDAELARLRRTARP